MPAQLRIEDRAGGIRVLSIHHPARKNALDAAAIAALSASLAPERLAGVRALVIRGDGHDAFCAGYDLTALADVGPNGELPDDSLEAALEQLAACPVPSIALVHGPAFGAGCDLACACDVRIGSESARFCMPPARLGVVYAAAGIARVRALVGPARAKRMFFTGMVVGSGRALEWGLIDERLPATEAEAAAVSLAETIAQMAPLAVRGMKQTFAALAEGPISPERSAGLRALRREAFQSDDAREGKAAFLEKRPPRFAGK